MKIDGTMMNTQVAAVQANQPERQSIAARDATEKLASNAKYDTPTSKEGATDQVSLNITVSQRTLDTIQKLGEVSDVLNSMAKSLRSTDKALKASTEVITKMKEQLGKIVKNFPPFPLESSERRDLQAGSDHSRGRCDRCNPLASPDHG